MVDEVLVLGAVHLLPLSRNRTPAIMGGIFHILLRYTPIFFFLRWFLFKYVFKVSLTSESLPTIPFTLTLPRFRQPFGRALVVKKDEVTVHKLAESLSKVSITHSSTHPIANFPQILYYGIMSIACIRIVRQHDWFFNTRALWTGFPNPSIE